MNGHFVNLWGKVWVRASHVVSVVGDDDPEWFVGTEDPPRPAVFVRMNDGVVHSNVFEDVSMNVDAFVQRLIEQLVGEDHEGEG